MTFDADGMFPLLDDEAHVGLQWAFFLVSSQALLIDVRARAREQAAKGGDATGDKTPAALAEEMFGELEREVDRLDLVKKDARAWLYGLRIFLMDLTFAPDLQDRWAGLAAAAHEAIRRTAPGVADAEADMKEHQDVLKLETTVAEDKESMIASLDRCLGLVRMVRAYADLPSHGGLA